MKLWILMPLRVLCWVLTCYVYMVQEWQRERQRGPLNGLFEITWVSCTRKVKLIWILMKQQMMRWQWRHLDHIQIICTLLQADNYASTSSLNFFTSRMLFLTPNQQCQALKAVSPSFLTNLCCTVTWSYPVKKTLFDGMACNVKYSLFGWESVAYLTQPNRECFTLHVMSSNSIFFTRYDHVTAQHKFVRKLGEQLQQCTVTDFRELECSAADTEMKTLSAA